MMLNSLMLKAQSGSVGLKVKEIDVVLVGSASSPCLTVCAFGKRLKSRSSSSCFSCWSLSILLLLWGCVEGVGSVVGGGGIVGGK